MKDKDAAASLVKLQHDGDIETFNSFWGKLKKEVEKTGIHMLAESEDFEVLKDRVAHFREMLFDNFDTIHNQNKAIFSGGSGMAQWLYVAVTQGPECRFEFSEG
jgi:hypothetical protein